MSELEIAAFDALFKLVGMRSGDEEWQTYADVFQELVLESEIGVDYNGELVLKLGVTPRGEKIGA